LLVESVFGESRHVIHGQWALRNSTQVVVPGPPSNDTGTAPLRAPVRRLCRSPCRPGGAPG
jgi:hypothetical protein